MFSLRRLTGSSTSASRAVLPGSTIELVLVRTEATVGFGPGVPADLSGGTMVLRSMSAVKLAFVPASRSPHSKNASYFTLTLFFAGIHLKQGVPNSLPRSIISRRVSGIGETPNSIPRVSVQPFQGALLRE